jgi:hypothetical protein
VERIESLTLSLLSCYQSLPFILFPESTSSFTAKEWNGTHMGQERRWEQLLQKGTWQKVAYHLSPPFRLRDALEFQHFSAWMLLRKSPDKRTTTTKIHESVQQLLRFIRVFPSTDGHIWVCRRLVSDAVLRRLSLCLFLPSHSIGKHQQRKKIQLKQK